MANYFFDTEFHEGFHKPTFGRNRHFIDLISIGIVAEDGREYYAISKDFDIKSAWNAYDWKDFPNIHDGKKLVQKVYWLRDNVLKSVFEELHSRFVKEDNYKGSVNMKSDYDNFRYLIKKYGKSNKQIADEINAFCITKKIRNDFGTDTSSIVNAWVYDKPEFYAYYADYDWVVFCSLFGKMIDLPKGFPMVCFDIQQMVHQNKIDKYVLLKEVPRTNEHNASSDARWNFKAYQWIKNNINEKGR